MIIHSDKNSPKTLEQKVQELILKKLYIKVDDEKIFIDKEDFIGLILKDIIPLAKADFDINEAVQISLKEQKEYKSMPNVKRNELEEAAVEFKYEIEAYQFYLDGLRDEMDEDEIYNEVLLILNSEQDLLKRKLQELILESLTQKVDEETVTNNGQNYDLLLTTLISHVKTLASHDNIDKAAEAFYNNKKDFFINNNLGIDFIKNELERFQPALKDEISAYKMALSMNDQNAEFSMILAMVKQLLNLES